MKFFTLFLISAHALAINIQQFQRSNTLTYEMLEDARVKNSHVFNDYDLAFVLGASYIAEPLTLDDADLVDEFRPVIKDMKTVHFGISAYLLRNLMLGATSYYSIFKDDLDESKSGIGDTDLKLTWRFLSKERFAAAVMPIVTLPTAGSGSEASIDVSATNSPANIVMMNPLGDGKLGFGVMGIYEHFFDFMNLVVNVGYKNSPDAVFRELDGSKKFLTGIGAYVPITQRWGVNAEVMRDWSSNFNKNDLYVGTSFGIARRIAGFAGVGIGVGGDGNSMRASAGIKFTPRVWSEKREAIKPIRMKTKRVTKTRTIRPRNVVDLEEDTGVQMNLDQECQDGYVFDSMNTFVVRFPHDVGLIISPEQLEFITSRIKDNLDDIEKIYVTGHTSSPGEESYNMGLSKKRAISVSQLLVSRGIPKEKVFFRGRGESMLIDNSGTSEAEEINRRVEIEAILKTKSSTCK